MTTRSCFETDLRAVLSGAFADAIETMAFVTPEPTLSPEIGGLDADSLRRVTIGFRGHGVDGTLELLTTCRLGAVIAASLSGEDDAVLDPADAASVARAEDALQELANVVCGTVLRQLATGHERPRFALSLPSTTSPSGPGGADAARELLADPDTATLVAEGELVAARLTVTAHLSPQEATH